MTSNNYEKWDWEGTEWKCLVCGAAPAAASHQGKAGLEPNPYNKTQRYCSSTCADKAKDIRQRARREAERAAWLSEFRCVVCSSPATDLVRGCRRKRRLTCSFACQRKSESQARQLRSGERQAAEALKLLIQVSEKAGAASR